METSNDGRWRAEDAIAGYTNVIEALREIIIYPFIYSQESHKLGLKWPRGLLLYGPPGTGKTSLVQAVVRECNAHLTMISPHSILSPYAGESERLLRDAFSEASLHVSLGKPSVIFIDEIDALCSHRDSRREEESRIVAQLLTLMSGSKASSKFHPGVVVVASTNRVNAIDPALRRPGRFDVEIEVIAPTEEERLQILELYSRKFLLDKRVDLKALAASCNGYVGADLEALCREASLSSLHKVSSTSDGGSVLITMDDWKYARSKVHPSITRGITVEIPKVSWEEIGGLSDLKRKLRQAVEWPIKHASAFKRLGISPVRGVLLHGPPGCSKTTLAKAAAHAAEAAFFSLSGADLFSMYVRERERGEKVSVVWRTSSRGKRGWLLSSGDPNAASFCGRPAAVAGAASAPAPAPAATPISPDPHLLLKPPPLSPSLSRRFLEKDEDPQHREEEEEEEEEEEKNQPRWIDLLRFLPTSIFEKDWVNALLEVAVFF